MMEPNDILDILMKELSRSAKDLKKAKSADEREQQSRIVKNLSESLGVFMRMAVEADPEVLEDLEDFDPDLL